MFTDHYATEYAIGRAVRRIVRTVQKHVGHVDAAEDHAESTSYDEQDTDESRLSASVRVDGGRGTVGVVRHVRDYDLLL